MDQTVIPENRIKALVDQVIKIIQSYLGDLPFQLYLFGSRAQKSANHHSDIDLAVSCQQLDPSTFHAIRQSVRNMRTLYTIDLIHLQRVDPEFGKNVLDEGVKVYG